MDVVESCHDCFDIGMEVKGPMMREKSDNVFICESSVRLCGALVRRGVNFPNLCYV
jgi:hypothetical protein